MKKIGFIISLLLLTSCNFQKGEKEKYIKNETLANKQIDDVPQTVNNYFDDAENSEGIKSFIDACLIRYYNGGLYHRLRIIGNQKPYWQIDRDSVQSGFYVEHICSQDE